MLAYAIDNAAPSTIVLISGDRDFAYALSILKFRRYRIVLITLPNAHQSLRAQASISYDWVSEILESVDPTLLNQPSEPTTPRRGKFSSPPAHDKFYPDSTGSSSLFQDSYDGKSTNSVELMNNYRDETRRTENFRTPSKHDAKRDSLPPYLERHLAASSSSMALDNGPGAPARVVHSPVASHPIGRIQTPLATIPYQCGSELNFASRTTQTQTRLLQALQSCHLDVLSDNPPPIRESSPFPHQQGSPSPIKATRPLSSVDRIAVDDNHSDSPQPPPENVTAKITASTPSLIPPSSTLSSATVSAITQMSENRRQAPSNTVPDKFKILIRCLKIHRSRGNLRSLRCEISSEIAQNGATYRLAGVSTFGEYVVMAEKAGIVELGGSDSNAWITLKAPWYNVANARLS
jgi:NYN domain